MCAASDGNDHLQRPRTQHHAKMIALEVLPPQTVVRSDDERARKGAVAADAMRFRARLTASQENNATTSFKCACGRRKFHTQDYANAATMLHAWEQHLKDAACHKAKPWPIPRIKT